MASHFEHMLGNLDLDPDAITLLDLCVKYLKGDVSADWAPERKQAGEEFIKLLWPQLMEGFLQDLFPQPMTVNKLIKDGRLQVVDLYREPATKRVEATEVLDWLKPRKGDPPGFRPPAEAYDTALNVINLLDNFYHAMDTSRVPIIDQGAAGMLGLGSQPGSPRAAARRAAAPFAGELFARLPNFPSASLDEIIDIRKELQGSVKGFQKAVLALSVSLLEVPTSTFQFEAEKVFIQNVQPQLDELEELIHQNRYLRRLTSGVVGDWKANLSFAGAVAGAGAVAARMSGGAMVNDILSAALGTGAGIPALKAATDRMEGARAIRDHKFFFYYQLERRLGQNNTSKRKRKSGQKKPRTRRSAR